MISCDVFGLILMRNGPIFGVKNGSHQWENLENLLLNLTANNIPKINNYVFCLFIVLSKNVTFVTAITFRGKVF